MGATTSGANPNVLPPDAATESTLAAQLDITLSALLQPADLNLDGDGDAGVNVQNQPTVNVAEAQNEANIAHGQDTVTTAGTPEQLNGGISQAVPDGHAVTVKALNANTDLVYVGDKDNNPSSSTGFELAAGEAISLAVTDVSEIEIDVDTNGEGVCWIVEAT